jgi:hypothetical protein
MELSPVVSDEISTHVIDVAEAQQGVAPGILGGHPERAVAFLTHREMEMQLFVDFSEDVAANQAQVAEPVPTRVGHLSHHRAGSARKTRVTA